MKSRLTMNQRIDAIIEIMKNKKTLKVNYER
jgi:hypothetical protein